MHNWSDRFLAQMKVARETPSSSYLDRLIRAHLNTFAFENISKCFYLNRLSQHGWVVPPPDVWLDHAQAYEFGGTCFSMNAAFARLLGELGFPVYPVQAFEGKHMCLLTQVDGKRYLADVGLGGPTLGSIDLATGGAVGGYGQEVHVLPMPETPGMYYFDQIWDGERARRWELRSRPATQAEIDTAIAAANTPGSTFLSLLICGLYQDEQHRHVRIRNNLFTIRHEDGSKTEVTLRSVAEIESVLHEEFRLTRLPGQEAVETLRRLGVNVFAEV